MRSDDRGDPEAPRNAALAAASGDRLPAAAEGYDAVAGARRLARCARFGALAVHGADGFPFSSLVNVATDIDGSPILLLSDLAVHTQRLAADPRAALLLAQPGKGDPLAHPRVTLIGEAERRPQSREGPGEAGRLRLRFLARHPKSALYADFADFSFWTLRLRAIHLNGGFARAASLAPERFLLPLDGAGDLVARQADILERLNGEQAADLAACAKLPATGGRRGRDPGWRAAGVDPEGIDLLWREASERLLFPAPARDRAEVTRMVADMAGAAAGSHRARHGPVRQ